MVWTIRAEDRARTGHPDLGKVVLYQMSYFRIFVHLSFGGSKRTFYRTAKITNLYSLQNFYPYLYLGLYKVLSGTSTLGLPSYRW